MNNLTIEQQKMLAEFGGYEAKEDTTSMFKTLIIRTYSSPESLIFDKWESLDLTDWRIIKQLESKIMKEGGYNRAEFDLLAGCKRYYDGHIRMNIGESTNPDPQEAEKEAILNAVWEHIKSKK
jgi:hypothetical protein